MGHHYVPQRLLRKFEVADEPGFIWQYDKQQAGLAKRIPIKVVAQASEFYEPEMEARLANEVELPGGDAIDRVIRGDSLDSRGRLALALYLGTMLKRVPTHRRRMTTMVPGLVIRLMADIRNSVRETLSEPEVISTGLHNLNEIESKYNIEALDVLRDQIRNPWPNDVYVQALSQMTWSILTTEGSQLFIISDNPIFFTEGLGLGNPGSEFLMPLSPNHVIHGVNQGRKTNLLNREEIPPRIVREINKRTAWGSHRFAYGHVEMSWLPKLLMTENPEYRVLNWKH